MPGFIGFPELLLLGLLALILFGPKRLPEMGRGLGKGMREFKESIGGDKKDAFDTAEFTVHADDEVTMHDLDSPEVRELREVHEVEPALVVPPSSERVA
jgi:sec-independent protein translocase protein TatA